jgi:hypothetical protein
MAVLELPTLVVEVVVQEVAVVAQAAAAWL